MHSEHTPISRRRFLVLGGGAVTVTALGAYGATFLHDDSTATTATTAADKALTAPSLPAGTTATSATASSSPSSSSSPATASDLARRRLVIVQLSGGNDGLNTVVPIDGRYHDARPTIGVKDSELIALPGVSGLGLHPSLSPLMDRWSAGQLAVIRGIGFSDPNRSHFASMDRWWRADEPSKPGWLGRTLDALASDPRPLYATSLGGRAPLLSGGARQPTTVASAKQFQFRGVPATVIDALSQSSPATDPLTTLTQQAFYHAVAAVSDFVSVSSVHASDPADPADEAGKLSDGLAMAANLLTADVGTRLVVVSASGFDTHANQRADQDRLLADLAHGISTFFASIDAAGLSDDVMLVTTSEFGRRVAENGSGGTDHGAGSVSFAVGKHVMGGVFGDSDLGNLLEGDVRPVVDPRALYTNCLDWIGADAEQVLGRRYGDLALLG